MLQIIGWLGCVYLVVKALEIGSSSNHRNDAGKLKDSAIAACIIAWSSAVMFSIWLLIQGGSMGNTETNMTSINAGIDVSKYPSGPTGYLRCNDDAKNLDEKIECGKLIR